MQNFEGKFTINGWPFKEGFLSYQEVIEFPPWLSDGFVSLPPMVQYYEVLIQTRGQRNAAEIWRDSEWLIQYKHPSGYMENWKVHRDKSDIHLVDLSFEGHGRMFELPTFGEQRIFRAVGLDFEIKRIRRQVAGYLWRQNGEAILRTTGPCV